MTQRIVIIFCLAVVLAACGAPGATPAATPSPPSTTATAPPSGSAQLDGTAWVLLLLNNQPPIDGSKITLSFSDGNQFGGSGGCNSYGGTYTTNADGTWTFGTWGGGAMGCLDPQGVMEQERVFLDTFRNVARYRLSANRLELQDTAGATTLIFTPQDSTATPTAASAAPQPTPIAGSAVLDNTQWDLLLLHDQPPVAGARVLLRFVNGSELAGDDGCNYYGGSYTATENTWALVEQIQKTTSACDTPNLTDQEAAYYDALRSATTYHRSEDQLLFADAAGNTILVFTLRRPPVIDAALMGGWELVTLNGQPPVADTRITINFNDKDIDGHAGCNGYGSTWLNGETLVASNGVLVLPGPAATQAGCSNEAISAQETAYLEALSDVATYSVTPEQLEIKNAAGATVLVFRREVQLRNNAADLIGTRWQLRTFNDQSPLPNTTYSLIFDSATDVHGMAGCREYKATYEVTSDDLRFPSTEMMGEDCMRPSPYSAQDVVESLGSGARYRLSPTQLEIFPVHGGTLVWEPLENAPMTPEPTVWTLQAFAEGPITTPVLPDTTITLQFDQDTLRPQGTVFGSAGCNTYHTTYTFDVTLAFSPIVTSRMACPPPIMEQEARFLRSLEQSATHRLGDELRLETEDGRALVFAVQE